MLRVVCSRSVLALVALVASTLACGGRVTGDAEPSDDPPLTPFGPEKTPTSVELPSEAKPSTAGHVDTSFAGTGTATLDDVSGTPVCLTVATDGRIWVAARDPEADPDAPRALLQLDARGSLDAKVARQPPELHSGVLGRLVGLEACSRTADGELVVVHRGGQLGGATLPVGPGIAYVSKLVATSPEVRFDTVLLPFTALVVETEPDGTYVVAADNTSGVSDLLVARVRQDGVVLGPVVTPAVRHFHVRRLLRDNDTVLVAGMVDGANAYPNVMVGRLDGNTLAWTYPGLADMATSLGPRDRFGLALDDDGHAFVAVGPGLTVARFAEHSAPLALDATFGSGGRTLLAATGIAWDAVAVAGERLVVATSNGLVRMTADGERDLGWGSAGTARITSLADRPIRVARTPDGAVLVGGESAAGVLEITRYTP